MASIASLKPWQIRTRIGEIRDAALAQLLTPQQDFDGEALQRELTELVTKEPDRKLPSFLEADILLALGGGARPRRAQKSLYRLYKERVALGEIPEFESFEQTLKQAETNGVSLEGLYFPQSFWSMSHEEIWADVGTVMRRVGDVLGDLFLNSGTLLGVVRDQSLISHDDDVDLAVVLKASSAQEAGREWKNIHGVLKQHDLLSEREGRNPTVYKLKSDGVYNIDLFPAWIEEGRVFVYPHTFGELDESDLYPLKDCPVTGLAIPQNPQAMLALNYGEGWRAPDPGFEFPWTHANRRFAAFRESMDMDDEKTAALGNLNLVDPKTIKPWQRRARSAEIHEIAARQLEDPDEEFDHEAYLKELHTIEAKPRLLVDLEARIMLLLGAQQKPVRIKKLINRLRDRRIKYGEPHLFDEFEQKLKDLLGVDALLGHNFSPTTFASLDHDEVWGDVESAVKALGRLSDGVFLNSGTLLGVTRDKRLIDHDDDVDLGFLMKAKSAQEAVAEWLVLKDTLRSLDLLLENGKSRNAEIYKIKSSAGILIDLFPAWIEDGKVFVFPHTFGSLNENEVFPLKTCEVSGLPIPAEPEKMLELNYGPGWRVPDPYFKFPWRQAKVQFSEFCEGVRAETAPEKHKTVLTYGTFDLFHIGHVRLLRRLSEMGDRLIVGCSTDEFNAIKGKTCVMPYEERAEILRACSYVTDVIPENEWAQKRGDVVTYKADIFAMGDDWEGKFDDLADLCEVVYLPRTEEISTTDLKKRVQKQSLEKMIASLS